MTRACRDCKFAKLPTLEQARKHANGIGNINGAWMSCLNGEDHRLVQPGTVCDQWEPWHRMGPEATHVDFQETVDLIDATKESTDETD